MDAERIIAELGLVPHPEGGHFRETFRDPEPNGGRAQGESARRRRPRPG